MSKFANALKSLRNKKGLTQEELAEALGVAKSTISMYEVGSREPNFETLEAIADFFNVPMAELINNKKTPTLTKKDERDIAKDLERLVQAMDESDTLMFDGEPMSEEAKESIAAAMKLGLEAAKVKNKERFTPKKYRK